MTTAFNKSLYGQYLRIDHLGRLFTKFSGRQLQLTNDCVDASITVGAENTNVRALTIQLKDGAGKDLAHAEIVTVYVFSDATMQALATGGSTGIAIGTDGTILNTVVAKKIFTVISEADGDIDLTWTDTGTESVVVAVRLPNGSMILTAPFANT
jgi:hypothetical protein